VKYRFLFLLIFFIESSHILASDNTFGGWEFVEVNHDFKNRFFGTFYFEFDNYDFNRMECWYSRFTGGYKINSWLKTDVAFDIMKEPSTYFHRYMFDLTGTLKQGNLKVAIRERIQQTYTVESKSRKHILRSRLKAQYAIPKSAFTPYIAIELFTWEKWNKTRHYVGSTFKLSKIADLDFYYMYYTFDGKPAQHVIGTGVNFDL